MTPEQYEAGMRRALNGIIERAEHQPKHPVRFSANLFFAHGAMVKRFPADALIAYADALKEAGASRIDINPGPLPWKVKDRETIEKYDALIRHIHQLGMEVSLNPEYNHGTLKIGTLSEWKDIAVDFYAELARRYHPEIFVLVHEPTTMTERMGIEASPAEWRDFVQKTAAVVKRESPGSRLAAGGLAKEIDYFREFAKLPEVDLLTMDIYNLRSIETNNEMVSIGRAAGKPVYIEETWRPWQPLHTREQFAAGIGSARFENLDALWLKAMVVYASANDLGMVTPFWTQTFFYYGAGDDSGLDNAYNQKVVEALRGKRRTNIFNAYQELARSLANN
jgi:hypothetical protein